MSSASDEAAALEPILLHDLPPETDSVPPPERTGPERIGRYELCFELASGGMATVYLARVYGASGFEKLVALKRIHPHLAKERKYVEMFLDEAKIASRITHPNVCSVFDFGQADGEYYIAMEYLVGEPLSRLCGRVRRSEEQRRHPLLPLRMAGIVAEACEGLHAAHELKDANGDLLHIVHRDVSPRNLFMTYDGSVQVVDFGIASARQRLHQTATGQVKGTFAYMAPEQLTAQPIDRRVDVWSLGVALWELLAVKRLFRRDTTGATVHAVLYEDIDPPSAYRRQVPPELDAVVMKALAREPDQRWQTARDMGRALRQFLGTRDEVLGPAELADWMREVFPEGQARKSLLLEVARMSRDPVPSMPHAPEADASFTSTRLQLSHLRERPGRRHPWKRRLGGGAIVALLVLAAAITVTFTSIADDVDSAPEATVASQTTAPRIDSPVAAQVQTPVGESAPPQDEAPQDEAQAKSAPTPEETSTPDERRKARAPSGPGTINLVTRGGWAAVYEGKRRLGSTPSRITLPSGRHRLVLKPFGDGKPKVVVVKVEAGKTRNVAVALE